jgi:hypothetical protein
VGAATPGHAETFGAITLHDPWIETDEETETLFFRGAASATNRGFIQDRVPQSQVVWRNEVRPSRITEITTSGEGSPRLYSPEGGHTAWGDRVVGVDSISDIMRDISEISRGGEKIPRVIVLDSRISVDDEQLTPFFTFLLQQGIRLDLWSIGRSASPVMCRISRATLGRMYYTKAIQSVRPNEGVEWIVSVPLPPNVVTFGYPSDTTLSLFADIDVVRFADWLPVWPSLIKKVPLDGSSD